MERIARIAMEPVVEFGGARRGVELSSGAGEDEAAILGGSLRRSLSWMGDSDAEAERGFAGRSAVLEVAFRTRLESRVLKRAREAEFSVRVPSAGYFCDMNINV